MIPRRFRNWILVWTPLSWLIITLCTYPKDLPVIVDPQIYPPGEVPHTSFMDVIGGFFSDAIAQYPAWVMVLLALAAFAAGILGLVRRSKAKVMNILLLVLRRGLCGLGARRGRLGLLVGERPRDAVRLGLPDGRRRARRRLRLVLGGR